VDHPDVEVDGVGVGGEQLRLGGVELGLERPQVLDRRLRGVDRVCADVRVAGVRVRYV
jgi:hypothetical protein